MQETHEQMIDLRSIFKLIRQRLSLILFTTLIVTILGGIYTFFIATPVYTASTQLVAKLPNSDNSGAYAGQVSGNIQMANTINQVIVSPAILDKVKSNLHLPSDAFQKEVTASNQTNSQVIILTVKYGDPYIAQKIADETAKVFSSDAATLLNVTNVNVLSKAKVQTTPISPKPKLYIGVSVLLGLLLGLGIAFFKEVFDNKINSEADIESLGLSVLGTTTYAQKSDFTNIINKVAKKEMPASARASARSELDAQRPAKRRSR
ncbi:Wzz/FepE/Etk N-terminal domain-containing protein [Lactococcus paracarnosus]|uniref:Capsular polysaccharide biosynthesis protein CpsC n=1 Tax=Pseudolactococcus paracarnosus TaxID=2749962 RepID=A0ABT0AMT3_9LACT|nr:Wzz/FepE/Etk N-terminal domain-containing protein [Lactococcus paracarnosus]MCJ1977797.1 polysaccharide biosynthesis protein [Lactococcus paracarnosus]MCJ1998642.1 polysaccharide biosynthesis protein [Lactococcus paracarnosus]